MQIERMQRVLILGASRGLGAALVKYLAELNVPALGFARKEPSLENLRSLHPQFEYRLADFSASAGQDSVLELLRREKFSKVFCMAGGGPYARFASREWKDHQWALNVSFILAARVAHELLSSRTHATQLILVGSAVAEAEADPMAASYSAAKHALKGLWAALVKEEPEADIRLFSPGYMNTEMLPANAAVRQLGVYEPTRLARELWTWSMTAADKSGHKLYPKHPTC